jgi:hypothetical protein
MQRYDSFIVPLLAYDLEKSAQDRTRVIHRWIMHDFAIMYNMTSSANHWTVSPIRRAVKASK